MLTFYVYLQVKIELKSRLVCPFKIDNQCNEKLIRPNLYRWAQIIMFCGLTNALVFFFGVLKIFNRWTMLFVPIQLFCLYYYFDNTMNFFNYTGLFKVFVYISTCFFLFLFFAIFIIYWILKKIKIIVSLLVAIFILTTIFYKYS